MLNSQVCTSRFSPSAIHGLCAILASNSRFMRPFPAPLNTCCQPFSSQFARHGLRGFEYPKNLWRLFLRDDLTRLKITSEVKNNLKRLF